jgi:hypothetical protein
MNFRQSKRQRAKKQGCIDRDRDDFTGKSKDQFPEFIPPFVGLLPQQKAQQKHS